MTCKADARASIQLPKVPNPLAKHLRNLARSPLQVGSRRKKLSLRQKSALKKKTPDSCLRFSRARAQHSLGSSTIELSSTFAESSAYSPSSTCFGTLSAFPRQYHLCLSRATRPPRDTKLAFGRGAPVEIVQTQPSCHRSRTNRLSRVDSQLVSPLEGKSSLTPAGKISPPRHPPPQKTHSRKPGFGHISVAQMDKRPKGYRNPFNTKY